MKILLREWDNKYYVWKDATVDKVGCYRVGIKSVRQANILAIENDEREGYVQCASCGALVKNTPQDIEKHFNEMEGKKDCAKCRHLYVSAYGNIDRKIEKHQDGNYVVTDVRRADLKCGMTYSYNRPDIDDPATKRVCVFYACRRSGMKTIEDVFIQYPGLFNTQITVDLLNKKKCNCDGYKGAFFEYDLKCRNTVKACANELGIVDHFKINYRYRTYIIYYSEKYDMLLWDNSGQYVTVIPYGLTDEKWKQAKDKISALYKEAAKK